ncbi:hypothetical protein M0805_001211 [Coniferiporia weirii]|nr:hypothetical protein M0805_001211 [Coniferiporia weirii]
MITVLPPEILLNVLGYCSIQTICSLQLICKDFNDFVKENETAVYHAAALLHGFIEPEQLLRDAHVNYPGSWLDGLRGWKDLCQRWFQVETNWEGRGETPRETTLKRTGDDVHRIKVDERQNARFVITTHQNGGLRVTCMDTDTVLFALAKRYVRHHAHCEYENGFLIFDRLHPHALEVWRLESSDWDGCHPDSRYKPDETQIHAPKQVVDPSAEFPRRGSFAPWALFIPPYNPRAYRFVYPTLLVGSEEGEELYLFDVPSASLVQTIPIPRESLPPAAFTPEGTVCILYVELGPRHVFVCTMHGVLILPRDWSHEPGARNVCFDFPTVDPNLRVPQLICHYAARIIRTNGPPSNPCMREYMVTAPRVSEQSTALVRLGDNRQQFSAVHVSSSGRDFVAITWLGIAYFVRDFERVLRGECSFSEIALRIDMGAPAINLAFGHDRVVIQAFSGLFVFSLHTTPHGIITPRMHDGRLTPTPNSFPEISAHQLLHFRNRVSLRQVSCVSCVTKTGVWLDWSVRALEEAKGRDPMTRDEENELINFGELLEEENAYVRRAVCLIDFSPQSH